MCVYKGEEGNKKVVYKLKGERTWRPSNSLSEENGLYRGEEIN